MKARLMPSDFLDYYVLLKKDRTETIKGCQLAKHNNGKNCDLSSQRSKCITYDDYLFAYQMSWYYLYICIGILDEKSYAIQAVAY